MLNNVSARELSHLRFSVHICDFYNIEWYIFKNSNLLEHKIMEIFCPVSKKVVKRKDTGGTKTFLNTPLNRYRGVSKVFVNIFLTMEIFIQKHSWLTKSFTNLAFIFILYYQHYGKMDTIKAYHGILYQNIQNTISEIYSIIRVDTCPTFDKTIIRSDFYMIWNPII